jgi:hypothetical protein
MSQPEREPACVDGDAAHSFETVTRCRQCGWVVQSKPERETREPALLRALAEEMRAARHHVTLMAWPAIVSGWIDRLDAALSASAVSAPVCTCRHDSGASSECDVHPARREVFLNISGFCRHRKGCAQLRGPSNCDCGLGAAQEALIAALWPAEAGWQPIASAPNRTEVMVTDGWSRAVTAWQSGWRPHPSFNPTHWMSLPDPPAAVSAPGQPVYSREEFERDRHGETGDRYRDKSVSAPGPRQEEPHE